MFLLTVKTIFLECGALPECHKNEVKIDKARD